MNKELQGSLYYLFSNLRFSLLVFWGILMGVLVISLVSAFLIEDSHVSFNLSFPIYIFSGIFGYWIVKNAIPYLIKMGVTRKIIFVAIGIFGICLGLINSLISNVLDKIVSLISSSGVLNSSLSFSVDGNEQFINHIGQLVSNDGWLVRVMIDTSISFFLFGCLFIGGLIFYKFGVVGGLASFVVGFLFFLYAGNAGWLESFVKLIIKNFDIIFFYQLFGVGILVYLISYLFLRRLTLRG